MPPIRVKKVTGLGNNHTIYFAWCPDEGPADTRERGRRAGYALTTTGNTAEAAVVNLQDWWLHNNVYTPQW